LGLKLGFRALGSAWCVLTSFVYIGDCSSLKEGFIFKSFADAWLSCEENIRW